MRLFVILMEIIQDYAVRAAASQRAPDAHRFVSSARYGCPIVRRYVEWIQFRAGKNLTIEGVLHPLPRLLAVERRQICGVGNQHNFFGWILAEQPGRKLNR